MHMETITHMTAANATGSIQKAPNAKQMLTDVQDTNNGLQKNATDHIVKFHLTIFN